MNKNFASSFIIWVWRHLLLSRENKEIVKTIIFSTLPFLFVRNKFYIEWKEANSFIKTEYPPFNKKPEEFLPSIKVNSGFNATAFERQESSIAIVIHAFYPDIFKEILIYLKNNKSVRFTLYITSPNEIAEIILNLLQDSNFNYRFLPVKNHGRDILPFLKIVPLSIKDGHQIILKIHTKKSDHRQLGEFWRKDIFEKLLTEIAMQKAILAFNLESSIGLLGPTGHILPLRLYYGANAGALKMLSNRMGFDSARLHEINFIAGSMFYIRIGALEPLLNLQLDSKDFESESGQMDGTMAHAIERAFAISSSVAGYKMIDNENDKQKDIIKVNTNHPFTW